MKPEPLRMEWMSQGGNDEVEETFVCMSYVLLNYQMILKAFQLKSALEFVREIQRVYKEK